MLLLGKTFYRNTGDGGGGGGSSRTPKEIHLGIINIQGDYPTTQDLANAVNTNGSAITINTDDLVVFKVEYVKSPIQ